MRRASAIAALILLFSCAPPRRPGPPSPSRTARRVRPEPAEVKDPNFILVVSELVPNPEDDGVSFTKVFVDGKEAGQTAVGRKSEERALRLKLPLGNAPVRFEHWVLPEVGEWTRLDDALQPRERFVRVQEGTVARLELRFAEGEASNTVSLSRAPASR